MTEGVKLPPLASPAAAEDSRAQWGTAVWVTETAILGWYRPAEGREYFLVEFTSKCQMPVKQEDYMSMAEITISVPGKEKLLANLKPSNAAGPDGITPRVLRELSPRRLPQP